MSKRAPLISEHLSGSTSQFYCGEEAASLSSKDWTIFSKRDVVKIVDGCTDTDQVPKPPWLERKKAYIVHLKDSDSSTRAAWLPTNCITRAQSWLTCDETAPKCSNDSAGKRTVRSGIYRTLVTAFREHGDHTDLIDEFDKVVTEIEKLTRF